jgi:hypothetical protein
MVTSVKDIKDRLRAFLSDPGLEQDFRTWFALMLRDVHGSGDLGAETLAHEIAAAFATQERGPNAPAELTDRLMRLTAESPDVSPLCTTADILQRLDYVVFPSMQFFPWSTSGGDAPDLPDLPPQQSLNVFRLSPAA